MRNHAVLFVALLAACAPQSDQEGSALPSGTELQEILTMLENRAHLVDVPLDGIGQAWEIQTPGLRTWFVDERVVLSPHRADGSWRMDLTFEAWGREGQRQAAPLQETRADGPRVELVREGLTEWYVDLPEGLEQGFTLDEAPAGSGPVELLLRLDGDVGVEEDQDALLLSADGHQRLRYDTLVVVDAEGAQLPSELDVEGCETPGEACHIVIRFDDSGATWPVVVDPLFTQAETGPMSFGVGQAGYAVDVDGDWAIVGVPAPNGQGGSVVILERNQGGGDAWGVVFEDHISAVQFGVGFGQAVALDYPVAAVGAPGSQRIHLYVFTNYNTPNGPRWVRTPLGGPWTEFGASVDISGQLVAVGAPGAGSVRMYHRHIGGITYLADLTHASADARFGEDVALDGFNVLVGAPGANAAYLYTRDALGPGGEEEFRLSATFQHPTGEFGGAVALEDGTAVVAGRGAVPHVYREGALTKWALHQTVPMPLQQGEALGSDVALTTGRLVLSDESPDGESRVHVYDARDGLTGLFVQSETLELDGVGAPAVAASEDALVVGMPERNPDGGVQFFRATGDTWTGSSVQVPKRGNRLGAALARDGEWLFVGEPDRSPGGTDGAVHVVRRKDTAWQHEETLTSPRLANGFGEVLAVENGRLFVAAPGQGRVYHYIRQGLGNYVVGSPAFIDGAANGFGQGLALKGDFLIIGSPSEQEVHVRERHANGVSDSWGSRATLSAADVPAFGRTVAFDGTWIAAGGQGEVRMFELTPNGITQYNKSQIIDGRTTGFGAALALEDGVLAIGAPRANGGGAKVAGEVQLYAMTAGTNDPGQGNEEWARVATLAANTPQANAGLGSALDIEGSFVYAGAPGIGRVIRFGRNVGGKDNWGQDRVFSGGAKQYGSAVVAGGAVVVVGAPGERSDGKVFQHRVDADLPPLTRSRTIHIDEDQSITIDLVQDSHDPNGDPITIQVLSGPSHGNYANNRYTPDPNYHGTDSITFRARAGGENSETSVITIEIAEVNDKCVAYGDSPVFSVNEDASLTVTAGEGLANHVLDVDGDALSFRLSDTRPALGTLTLTEATGAFSYVPHENLHGTDIFTFYCDDGRTEPEDLVPITVQIHVQPMPDAPTVTAPGPYEIEEDELLSVSSPGLLQAAADVDGDLLHARLFAPPGEGFVTVRDNGGFVYEPGAEFAGLDSFEFIVVDSTGLESEPATVVIQVNEVNDPPVANDDVYEVAEDSTLNVTSVRDILLNDWDQEHQDGHASEPIARLRTSPSHGQLTGFAANGIFGYVPDPNWSGTDSFTYQAEDADGALSEPATVTIHVLPVNDPPIALDDEYEWNPEAGLDVSPLDGVLANDSDPDGDTLSLAALIRDVTYGTLEIDGDGAFTYEPEPGFEGVDTFSYTATDGESTTLPALVRIEVRDNPGGDTTPGGGGGGGAAGCDVSTFFVDRDGDGYGDDDFLVEACELVEGLSDVGGDCDDSDATVFPGGREIAQDGVDQDCSGADARVDAVGACATGGALHATWWLLAMPLVLLRRKGGR